MDEKFVVEAPGIKPVLYPWDVQLITEGNDLLKKHKLALESYVATGIDVLRRNTAGLKMQADRQGLSKEKVLLIVKRRKKVLRFIFELTRSINEVFCSRSRLAKKITAGIWLIFRG